MRYLSVCSGIEAATMAWLPLGWAPSAFAEIDKFPAAVLANRYGSNMPGEPLSRNAPANLGDITKFKEWDSYDIDMLVGGTPCQSFSVAGLRKGLDDPRGNLMLTYAAIAKRYQPRWLVWENVPGVLSSKGGRDFGAFLRALAECGYGFAYRVLDAQYVRVDGYRRAVPQRRRRVFVVGYLGDWRRAGAVLFEPEGLRGDTPPGREAWQRSAPTLAARTGGGGGLGTDFDLDGGLIVDDVARCVTAGYAQRIDGETENFVAHTLLAKANDSHAADLDSYVAHTLRAEGFDASEDGSGRGTPLVPVSVAIRGREEGGTAELGGDVAHALRASQGGGDKPHVLAPGVATQWAVRRLTPVECHRLQGFPDDFCNIPWRGKAFAPDGLQYKALGNSMAVNCMRWIGQRIQMVEGAA